ncbi:hypothetical protein PV328_001039 [Microctonus aethiopoides]|uniref:Exonuclease domain-containing protein n=1 Tax=Microctonus aethiopoides TaxID=144406 RepID=A0AA39FWQ5_9HYME|nr:hypothetical protein PV328_001039 [Microctonus aethiopoides]
MTSRLKNGRFVKKKTADKINKALESMAREKKSKAENTLQDTDGGEIPDENGIITWKVMAKNLKCTNCRSLLDLEKLFDFKTEGLNSHFKIKCDKCTRLNLLYKKYENIVGNVIESEARDSCKRAAAEERELVMKNVKKLCDTFAKAMEAAAGVELVNHSNILKEAGLQVRVVIGDEDSSMIAAVRADNPTQKVHKLSDKNHLTKNFVNELYKIRDQYKELGRKNVILHIKKCFTYAVSQNKGNSKQLAVNLKQIPDHIFSRHENCGNWCSPNKKHTLNLSDGILYDALIRLFEKYASNSHKFSIAASSQGNESFNNIVANKAHKNKCLSTTAACDIRVASAVCVKNDSEKSILNIQKKLDIPSGSRTITFVRQSDMKRKKRSLLSQSKTKKLQRIELKKRRELLRKSSEKREDITYESNCGINRLTNFVCDSESDLAVDEDGTNVVYFDFETTGFAADAHILQIAAICNTQIFNVYVHTKTNITTSASAVTKLRHDHGGNLLYQDKEVQTLNILEALESFRQFLKKLSDGRKKCLLVAHNARFDVPRLLRAINNVNASEILHFITGFADTLALFKSVLTDRKGPGKFKLESLSQDFLKNSDNEHQSFHDAAYNVLSLQNLVETLNLKNNLFTFYKKCNVYLQDLSNANKTKVNLKKLTELKGIISLTMCKKLAMNDISVDILKEMFKQEGDKAIVELFTQKVDNNKVRITKKKDIKKVLDFLNNQNLPKK